MGKRSTKGETSKNSNKVSNPSSSAKRFSLDVLPTGQKKESKKIRKKRKKDKKVC